MTVAWGAALVLSSNGYVTVGVDYQLGDGIRVHEWRDSRRTLGLLENLAIMMGL
jgi:hypothetical protein